MHQATFSDIEYSRRKRTTKREEFLKIMDNIIPWDEWVAYIVPYYPEGKRGRPPKGIEKMLRMYFLQCWFNLSDEGLEDAIYDSYTKLQSIEINAKIFALNWLRWEARPQGAAILGLRCQ
jgi:IS5 family transposase